MSLTEHIHTPLLREALTQSLAQEPISDEQEQVLLWLVWLSLSSVEDLARCLGKDEKTVWSYLDHLEQRYLITHVLINEPGWPRRHHRYHLTDLGLYVLVARQPEPISVCRLVQSYPVGQTDLLARLASPVVHLTLSDLISRLIAQRPPGYQVTSYQQPWKERYTSLDGNGHIFSCDAAFLLQTPTGDQHAYYVHIDQAERMFSLKAERRFLTYLFELREIASLSGAPLPQLLLISSPARFLFWAALLEQLPLQRGTTPLHGAIVAADQLTENVYAPIFRPFRTLPRLLAQNSRRPPAGDEQVSLLSLLDTPASAERIEQFSQYFTLKHLLISRLSGPLTKPGAHLPRYIGDSLQQEADQLIDLTAATAARQIAEAFHQKKGERVQIAALLSLALSDQQKEILAFLVRHPYLCEEDLLTALHPTSTDVRTIRRQLEPLVDRGIVQRFLWREAPTPHDQRRYRLTEPGLRYLSTRHQLSPAYYLFPVTEEDQDRRNISPLASDIRWTQRGSKLLRDQLGHTNGLYHYMRRVLALAQTSQGYVIAYWKSAREAVCWYRDPLTQRIAYARPDAELLYLLPGASLPQSLLIEYDAGTTFFRDYASKFEAYVDYQYETGTTLPPILVILKRPQSANAIMEAIHEVGAGGLCIVMVAEEEMYKEGLLPALRQISSLTR